MIKLYNNEKGVLCYWEAWHDGAAVTVHWGTVGQRGQTRTIRLVSRDEPAEIIQREAAPLLGLGFKPIEQSNLHRVVIQYKINAMGTSQDFDKRNRVEDLMNECLGWTGLGHCDGGDIGSGTMNVFCFVVDEKTAIPVMLEALNSAGLLRDAVLALKKGDFNRVLWPTDFRGDFHI